jgi:rhodanese-related sulfurtransferase
VAFQVIRAGQNPENVYALRGGLAAWFEAGYPLASGVE